MSGAVLVDRAEGVVTVTFSQPERRNAIDFGMYDTLERTFTDLAADPAVRAVVLRGAGGAFAGGTDIRHLADIADGEAGAAYEAHMRRVQESVLRLRVPVIAVVDGPCVGGGLVFAALSDLVYCTPQAVFGSPIARTLGNTLSATSIARLRQCFGPRRTADLLLTARLLTAAEALDAGFVNAVAAADEVEGLVDAALQRIRSCSPTTLWSLKEIDRRIDAHLADLDVSDVYRAVYGGADFREGVAAFLGKRAPAFGEVGR